MSSSETNTVHLQAENDNGESAVLNRLGNTSQCPICGSEVHNEAYHCTKCRSFFCYHCRARLGFNESVLQCANRECGYYGKLLCSTCDAPASKREAPMQYNEPIDGYWPGWLLLASITGFAVGLYFTWIAGILTFLTMFVGVGWVLHAMQFNIFGREREVLMERINNYHPCICCQSETKVTSLQKRTS